MEEPARPPDLLLELPPVRGERLGARTARYVRRHWARIAIVAGVAVTIGHTLGGVAGLWEFLRVARGQHTPAVNAAAPSSISAPRPFRSLVVMPVTASAAQPDEEQLAHDLTLELTTSTARGFKDGMVVSSGLAQRFKNRPRDPRAVGQELNVRYVVEGRLERTGATHELRVELIDSTDGVHLWSGGESFGTGADGLEAVKKIRNGLRNAVADATKKEILSLPKEQKAVWDLMLRAWSLGESPAELRQQQALFEEAIRLDPAFVPALLSLAFHLSRSAQEEPENHDALVSKIDDITLRAIRAAPNDPRAWLNRSMSLRMQGNWSAAFDASDQALQLDPFRSDSIGRRAALLIFAGRPAEALPLLDRQLELDPANRTNPTIWRCVAYVHLAQYQEAVPLCEKAAALFNFWTVYGFAAAAAAQTGNEEKAAFWKRKLLEANPRASIDLVHRMRDSDNAEFKKQRENLIAGLRKAGVPEK